MKKDDWKPLKDMNVPLFYSAYCDSITLENLYHLFKGRLEAECLLRKKKRKPIPKSQGIERG